MKYKIGDTIVIRPTEWYELHRDTKGAVTRGGVKFDSKMKELCGTKQVIYDIIDRCYLIEGHECYIADWMIDEITTDRIIEYKKKGLSEDEAIEYQSNIVTKAIDLSKILPEQSSEKVDEDKPKRRGRKPGSKNKPKVKTDGTVTSSRKIKDSMTKMVSGTKVIYWNDNKVNFSIGRYVRPCEEGGSVILNSNKEEVVAKNLVLYTPERLIKFAEKQFDETDLTLEAFDKLKSDILKLVSDFESKFGNKISLTLELDKS